MPQFMQHNPLRSNKIETTFYDPINVPIDKSTDRRFTDNFAVGIDFRFLLLVETTFIPDGYTLMTTVWF